MINYKKYMKKCMKLAKLGDTSPNPMVGCVVLNKDGVEISTGFHLKYGENHAERDALLKLKKEETIGGTLIVNLEPCSHFGKTPPCADLIVEYGIKTVVIAMRDVNPVVSGHGIKKLKDAGINVIEGVLKKEALQLNEAFVKNMLKKEIFVVLKTATTIDGKISTKNGSSKWVTSAMARNKGKSLRKLYDAILTTSATVIADNPNFDCTCKILLDREMKSNFSSKFFKTGKIYIVVDKNICPLKPLENIEYIPCPVFNDKLDLEFLFKKLYDMKIMSVFVEAGGMLNGELVSKGLVDKIYHFVAPKILADNSGKSCFNGRNIDDINLSINFEIENIEIFTPDILITYIKNS